MNKEVLGSCAPSGPSPGPQKAKEEPQNCWSRRKQQVRAEASPLELTTLAAEVS